MKQLKAIAVCGFLGAVMVNCCGCGALLNFAFPDTTTVRVVNNAAFDVEYDLYYGDDENTLEAFLVEFGEHVHTTLAPGESTVIAEDCSNLKAVIIDDADLRIIGGIGPETDSDVLRDGDEFGCGDTVTFTFTSSDLGTNFEVTPTVN